MIVEYTSSLLMHHCHAINCDKSVPPKLLFCLKHWSMVPKSWQRMVWLTYRPGQEVDKRPSADYLLVQSMVVALVAVLDGAYTRPQGIDHIYSRAARPYL